MRVVIVHREWGIYLGSCFGLGFWTKLDPAGQDSAVTFRDGDEAAAVMKTWECHEPDESQVKFVEINTDSGYASIEECVASGLNRWDPNGIPDLPDDLADELPLTSAPLGGEAEFIADRIPEPSIEYNHRGVPSTHETMRRSRRSIDSTLTPNRWVWERASGHPVFYCKVCKTRVLEGEPKVCECD